MKLLLLDQFSEPGGAQQGLLELLPAIAARGWSATVALPGSGELFDGVSEAGFQSARVSCGPYRSGRKSWRDVARFALDAPRLAAQVRRLSADADLVYVNGPRLLPGVALAAVGPPVLFHAHSYLPAGPQRNLVGWAIRRTHASVAAVCESVAAPWHAMTGDNVRVIYNGVAGPPAPVWKGAGCVVGCIGRVAPEKGQLEFVRAAQLISRAIPQARFVVHGAVLFGDAKAKEYDAQMRKQAADLPIEFPGWTPNVYDAFAGIDLLLVPSAAQEATTRVILEAFAAGVPVIAFRSGGIPEVLEHGRTGWLAKSADEMAELAIDLLRCRQRLSEVSRAARRTWERRFTQARYHHELLSYFEELTKA